MRPLRVVLFSLPIPFEMVTLDPGAWAASLPHINHPFCITRSVPFGTVRYLFGGQTCCQSWPCIEQTGALSSGKTGGI
ncbi:uncharacterized protein BDZ83DRAFT_620725 [Colletotrichum acutatum]|uniref:Uncharacterized protein n=1 Tax=Glomerella acutata TaxID=27357 RepID=A0AAD8XGC1_GLOAC|nr:uncharacterized protein BDZ83DRAFT_620725 [Colletotrichum acutatum]KAK1725206.1 hypothetical protein BDZ83DRAFT_620725 [Colletotrichum acutatum]